MRSSVSAVRTGYHHCAWCSTGGRKGAAGACEERPSPQPYPELQSRVSTSSFTPVALCRKRCPSDSKPRHRAAQPCWRRPFASAGTRERSAPRSAPPRPEALTGWRALCTSRQPRRCRRVQPQRRRRGGLARGSVVSL